MVIDSMPYFLKEGWKFSGNVEIFIIAVFCVKFDMCFC